MIIVIATIQFQEAFINQGKAALEALITPTRSEDGCIQYDLHQNSANPCEFVFYERWQSKAHLEKHAASEHIAKYLDTTTPLLSKASKVEIYHLV